MDKTRLLCLLVSFVYLHIMLPANLMAIDLMNLQGMNDWMSKLSDSDKLSLAVNYFQNGKYHEALLIFGKLNKKYKLNPRFLAYTGVCMYYDGDYENAAATFEKVIDKVSVFSPHEQAVYYYCAAESKYHIGKFSEAIPLYERHLVMCYNNEKGDSLYSIGLCYKKLGKTEQAQEYLIQALAYYRKFNDKDKMRIVERHIEKDINE